jgi:hypothetical protein
MTDNQDYKDVMAGFAEDFRTGMEFNILKRFLGYIDIAKTRPLTDEEKEEMNFLWNNWPFLQRYTGSSVDGQ